MDAQFLHKKPQMKGRATQHQTARQLKENHFKELNPITYITSDYGIHITYLSSILLSS